MADIQANSIDKMPKRDAKYRDNYRKGKISLPSDNDTKDREWYLKWHHYAYGLYTNDYLHAGYGGVSTWGRSFKELREYSRGINTPVKYQNILDKPDGEGNVLMNISWDVPKILPKFVDIAIERIMRVRLQPGAKAMDDIAEDQRNYLINQMKLRVNPMMQELAQMAGKDMPTQDGINKARDIEIINQMGGIKLAIEIMLQDALQVTDELSDIEELTGYLIRDLVDVATAAKYTYWDRLDGKVKHRYIDPERLIARGSKYPDHRDIDFGGFIESKTINEIREESGLEEEQIIEIAKSYANNFKGDSKHEWGYYKFRKEDFIRRNDQQYSSFDDFKVDVMNLWWIAGDAEKYVMGFHSDGNMIFDKVNLNSRLSKYDRKKGKDFYINTTHKVYHSKWVVGTNIIYGYGEDDAIVRFGNRGHRRAVLPITIYSIDGPSMVERCIGDVDDICLMTFKKRHTVAKLPPAPRMVIYKDQIRDTVEMGKKSFSIQDIVGAYPSTGILLLERAMEFDDINPRDKTPPIQFMQGGIAEDMALFNSEIHTYINNIRLKLGINEVADGTARPQEMLKSVMEGLDAATNNALRPVLRAFQRMRKMGSAIAVQKWKLAVLNGDIKIRYYLNGTVKASMLTKELAWHEFAIAIKILLTERDKELMLQDLITQKNSGNIRPDDYFVLYNLIKEGDIEKAQYYFAKAQAAREAEQHQRALEIANAQGRAGGEAAQMAEQAKAQVEQIRGEMKKELESIKAQYKDMLAANQHEREKELVYLNQNQ